MAEAFSRTQMLLGETALWRLRACRVAVFGVGGVGGYVVEALARCGVGALDLIDKDQVAESNLNRQLYALHSTIGCDKVDVAAARVRDINPDAQVRCHKLFYLPETAEELPLSPYDYIVDAIDTVSGKLTLIERATACGVPVISSMGAGNKLDPTAFVVADIYETSVCPLARVMRRELRKRGVPHLKVVYSREKPISPMRGDAGKESSPADEAAQEREKQPPGSVSFVPPVAGLILAGEVIRDLCAKGGD